MVAPVVVNSIDSAGLPQPVSPSDPMPVNTGASGVAHNRNAAAVATVWANSTNTFLFPTGVTSVSIACNVGGATTIADVLVAFDAPSDAVASAWVSATGGQSADVNYEAVMNGTVREFTFSAPIYRVDLLALGAACRCIIGAV